MSFRKPFRAVPISPAARYQRGPTGSRSGSVRSWLFGAALAGTVVGTGTVAATPDGRAVMMSRIKPLAVAFGVMRARAPEDGDHWGGCDDARAAGTAPIYLGEPGYRPEMDGDSDGIACEPIPR
jgi:Excalibur calcium-binding domain